ncbi:hypothetical protein CYK95_12790 [Clostridium perfringens]|nr:hypothetical protein CYK95_12790 [Clostridium perfringens]
MTTDEVEHMPDSDSIVFIRGQFPFYTKKYKIEKDKNYKYLGSDGDNPNNFYYEDLIEKNNSPQEKIKIEDISFDLEDIENLEYELSYELDEI